MNNIANSLLHKSKIYLAFAVRYIVFIGRKYPLIAVGIIVGYGFFFYQSFLTQKVAQNNLPLPTQSLPSSNTNSDPTTINNQLQTDAEIEEKLKEQEIAKLEEKRRQEKQKRISIAQAAFKQGSVFNGKLVWRNESQPIRLEISAVIGSTYVVEISNTEQGVSQIFEGKLVEEYVNQGIRYNPDKPKYFLFLGSRSPQDLPKPTWQFFRNNTNLILIPSDLGIDGKADSLFTYPQNLWDYSLVFRNQS
ncbi:MAG: hypothetical protein QNJ34_11085 [Xenococcaceae cyanobacterium MO_188.B29]|nr:hypothetical protein [Xenococcaceae cyanobacterium MO_188.B29]